MTSELVVRAGRGSHTLHPATGVAVIGRDAHAAVRVDDERISRWHVRLEPHRDGWHAIDTSSNGMFVDGVRRSSALISGPMTIYLGAADGIPVTLMPTDRREADLGESTQVVVRPHEPDEDQEWGDETDAGVVRAGRAVAERRHELQITQRNLAQDRIINAGTLIALEKGRSWPRRSTLARLEKALQWPPGTITRIREGMAATPGGAPAAARGPVALGGEPATEVLTDTVHAPLMAETVELAMHSISAGIAQLPDPDQPDFTPRATAILGDLRKLEKVAASAARNAKGTPSIILALSNVRRTYNDLMMRAARSIDATLGQRLYEARHRAELSLEEAANGAGLPIATLEDAEAERPISGDARAAIETLIAQLTPSR
jgi:transcriptional regulator with XRE-family HTH domain